VTRGSSPAGKALDPGHSNRSDARAPLTITISLELGHGQSMKEWFVAGVGLDENWLSLAEEALSFAAGSVDKRSDQ
jgi:hypothetical protein